MSTFWENTRSPAPADKGGYSSAANYGAEWGIHNTLTGFIIQSEDIAEERISDTTQDQAGAVVAAYDYDKRWTLTLNVIGTGTLPAVGDIAFQYNSTKNGTPKRWKVLTVTYNGSYNDKKKYTITAEAYNNWPPAAGS